MPSTSPETPLSAVRATRAWHVARDMAVPGDVARILGTLPEWFGIPESTAEYVEKARTAETWTARAGGDPAGDVRGVLLVDRPFAWVAEVHLIAVDRQVRGRGAGRALLTALECDARDRAVRLLLVKTLGPSHPDAGYAQTRRFYEAFGFLPLAETDEWGADNPCLFMVKPLDSAGSR